MLESLRKYATSWPAQVLMGLLVLSFAAWGVNDVFNGFRSNDVAIVGDTSVTVVDFQRDYDSALQNLSRQLGRQLSPAQAQQFGLPAQILARLVNQATLDNAATKMGLGISSDELGRQIAADPQFFGSGGTFDRRVLTQAIRAQGYTEDDYIIAQRRELMRTQIAQAFAGGVAAPVSFLRAVHEFQDEERDVGYIVIPAPAVSEIAEPGETELTGYFDAHKEEWKAPEVRAISYFVLTPADVARVDEISDADAQKSYDTQKERFVTAERRKVDQIVFKDRAEADAAATALAGGKTFDVLLTDRNLKPADVDLGLVTKDRIADPAVADAAFSLAVNGVSAVIDGQFGPVILRVTSIEPAVVTSFEAAKADLKKELAEQRAVAEVSATHDAIEDTRAGGDTLAEVASKYELKLVTIPVVDADGKDADGNTIADVPTGLVAAAFESDVGNINDPIQPDRNSYIWFDVTAVTAPRERALPEVREKVVAAWKDAERQKRLTEKADAAKQRLDNKEPLSTVAASLGTEVKTATKLKRAGTPPADLSESAIGSIFGVPKGDAAVTDGKEPMTRVVIVVDNVTVPEFSETAMKPAETGIDGQFITAFLGLYVSQLHSQTKVSFNRDTLQQVLGVADTAQ